MRDELVRVVMERDENGNYILMLMKLGFEGCSEVMEYQVGVD